MQASKLTPPADLDASRITTYDLCPKKYYNRYVLGLHEGPKHLNTRFSTHMFHEPIVQWYLGGAGWSPSEDLWASLMSQVAITEEEASVKANAIYSLENAKKLFAFYTERYAPDHDRFRITGVENYLLDNTNFGPIPFGSKPDISAVERATGAPWTIELKFSDWDFILEASTMNLQFLGQVNNSKGKGVLVTLIQPYGAKWSSFNGVRVEFEPKPEDLEAWRQDVQFKMDTITKSYETGIFPKNAPHACSSYGGCFFVDLCAAFHPPEMVARMPRHDDPLGYLGGGVVAKGEGEGVGDE